MTAPQVMRSLEYRVLLLEKELAAIKAGQTCQRCGGGWAHAVKTVPMDSLPPSQAILACLREFDGPIGIGVLRQRLESQGYPMQKFGQKNKNYFYTLIYRLAESQKIKRLDGDEVMMAG